MVPWVAILIKRENEMNFNNLKGLVLLLALSAPGVSMAANTVLTGTFDGAESRLQPLPGSCGGDDQLAYLNVGTIQFADGGFYTIKDAFNFNGVDVTALIYQGGFNPGAPLDNLVTPNGVDVAETIELAAGDYTLVVQQWCANVEGAWAVTFSGPGSVGSTAVATVPEMTQGVLTTSSPTAGTDCGVGPYQASGPMQVSRDGSYYYTDISIEFDIDMCLQVYSAPFDPANPDANRIGNALDDFGVVELTAGRDYYFVVQPLASTDAGEFFYVLAPPAPFRINKALAGSWFYPPTSGQGFFIDVFDKSNQMFLAWFTYDLERPDSGVTAMIGEPGHRWMTALGPFVGDTAELDIYWASGMVFDSETPQVSQEQDGRMTVTFTGCQSGTVDYDLGTRNAVGSVPVQPVAPDLVELCEGLVVGPGMPGPL